MNILISANIIEGYGLGNFYRMLTLYHYLVDKTDWSIHFESNLSYYKEIAQQNNICIIERKGGETYNTVLYDSPYNFLYKKNDEEEKKRIAFLKTISDKMIFFDDCRFDENNSDIAINLYNHNSSKINLYNGNLYSGIEYAILKAEILKAKESANNIYNKQRTVLLTLGGEDPAGITLEIVQQYYDCLENFSIVIGAAYKQKAELLKCVKNKASVFQSINNMGELMRQHDIIVCSGGTTLLEALYLQKTIIPMPQSDFETTFINNININFCNLSDLNLLIKNELPLMRYSKNIVDGKGLERIENIILNS